MPALVTGNQSAEGGIVGAVEGESKRRRTAFRGCCRIRNVYCICVMWTLRWPEH